MIAKFKKTSRPRWAGAMLLLATLACVVLTNAYVAKADFEFGEPVNLRSVIPVLDPAHDMICCFSYDGLEMYITSDRPGGYGDYDLWVLRRASIDEEWGPHENLGPTINSDKEDSWSSISADGLTLYFDSDRPGGYGNLDIYMTTRVTRQATWGPPVNLGSNINTSVLDAASWISADGLEFYFWSRRPGGYGNGDIYVARRTTQNDPWAEPMNLGPVVNTAYNEVGPCLSTDGLLLLFSDVGDEPPRPGGYGGGSDIWMTRRASLSEPWQTPMNLGPKVNGPDFGNRSCFSLDGRALYFFSNRTGDWENYQTPILPVVDLNGDGKVDLKDFRKLAQYWGQNEPSCDIAPLPNGDGIVDEKDLNLLAEYLLKELQPVAHWKLDEAEGIIAEDSVSNNDGTLNGNPLWQPAGGAVDGALQLDGVGDYVSTAFGLDPTKESFSVFAWIKGGAPGQVIICQAGGTDMDTRWLWTDSSYGRLMTWLMHPTYDPLVSESVITDGQWHHVGLVYDLDTFCRSLYVDGAEVAKDNSVVGGEPSYGGLYFGVDKMLGQGTFFSGLIDDIRIYDEVLSAEEVAELAR